MSDKSGRIWIDQKQAGDSGWQSVAETFDSSVANQAGGSNWDAGEGDGSWSRGGSDGGGAMSDDNQPGVLTSRPTPPPKGFIDISNGDNSTAFLNAAHIVSIVKTSGGCDIMCVNDRFGSEPWLYHGSIDQLLAKIAEAQR